jgi:hypothetical protein
MKRRAATRGVTCRCGHSSNEHGPHGCNGSNYTLGRGFMWCTCMRIATEVLNASKKNRRNAGLV